MNRFRLSFLRLAAATLTLGLLVNQAWAADTPSTATVTFGSWMPSRAFDVDSGRPAMPPLDRFPNVTNNTRFNNRHLMTPNVVYIKAGGTVNFIVSGFHNIIVYDDGKLPTDIDLTQVVFTTGTPNDIPIINDANNRIYRGLDPTRQAIDRVEAVMFEKAGAYLVICGLLPHFRDGMYGYVVVVP